MKVVYKTVREDDGEYCFACGKPLTKEVVINLGGGSGAEYELCRSCAKKLSDRIAKAIDNKVVNKHTNRTVRENAGNNFAWLSTIRDMTDK